MVEVIPCPKCNGSGCDICKGKGTILKDENGKFYVNDLPQESNRTTENNSWNLISKFVSSLLEEPHDFIWASKKIKK